MTQESFPEIQAATEALQTRIAIAESELAQMKESMTAKKQLVRTWRKALALFGPPRLTKKKPTGKAAAATVST